MASDFRPVAVLNLLLNRENPRHTPKEDQAAIIEHLLSDEEVFNLAKHMAKHGINPLEVVAVFPDDDGNLVVAEGNRRVCAAQLLTDPSKAPSSARARFKAMAEDGKDVSRVTVKEFPDYSTAQPWLQILHDGEQDGVGRRQWSPTQKARATTRKSTDALAVALIDYAVDQQWLRAEERDTIKLSTATRYLANPNVRGALGLGSAATSTDIDVHADAVRFERAARRFLADIQSGKLGSRSVGDDWRAYADELNRDLGVVVPVAEPWRASPRAAKPTTASTHRAAKARLSAPDTSRIALSKELADALNALGSYKLSSLYRSLTSLRLDEHPALLTTGAWVFLEALTGLQGKAKRISLKYIEEHGNVEKHDPSFSTVDARNLHNHFRVLDELFVRLVSECTP